MLTLANHLDRSQFEVHLAVVTGAGEWITQAGKDVIIHELKARRVRSGIWRLRQLIVALQPDVVMSTLMHLNVGLLMMRCFLPSKTRILVREGNLLSQKMREIKLPRLWRWLMRRFYPKADRIIAQCDAMADDMIATAGIPAEKITRIYNPVDTVGLESRMLEASDPFAGQAASHHLVAIGSLKPQKGFDRLLDSFAAAPEWLRDAHLWILGGGELRAKLMAQAERLEIADRVHFPGVQKNPYVWLHHADLFVLPSRYEGLPNVLLEAIACGCPVVAWEGPGGTREIMEACDLEARLMDEVVWQKWLLDSAGVDEAGRRLKAAFGLERILACYQSELIA